MTTIDHDMIKSWAEARGGEPAFVEGTQTNGSGMLRIKLDGDNENLSVVDWDKWFEVFDENELAFLYQDYSDKENLFFKIVDREENS